MTSIEEVPIDTEYIKLDSFLKWAGVAGTGGQAKMLLMQGLVRVNGENESRRGRKLVSGDVVEVQGIGRFRITTA